VDLPRSSTRGPRQVPRYLWALPFEGEQDRSRCLALAADARRWLRGRVVQAHADVRRRGTVARATPSSMTRGLAAIKQSIEALPMDDKAQLLEAVLTPQMRLRILVNQVRRRGDGGGRSSCRPRGQPSREASPACCGHSLELSSTCLAVLGFHGDPRNNAGMASGGAGMGSGSTG
jgi:hypothetical protein